MSLSLIDALVLLLQDEEEPPVNKQSAFNTIVMISKLLDDNHNLALKKVTVFIYVYNIQSLS